MAGLIPQQFIDDLLTRVDIIDVIDGYVALKKAGRNHQARCPFHEEKTPSFTVSQEKQFYHCFGCGANGTAITFLMEYAGLDFVSAIEELASRVGLEVPREGGINPKDAHLTQLYELMELVVHYYTRQLREHPRAQQAITYLKDRGLTGKLAADYELGYAPPGWDALINALGNSTEALGRLYDIGLVIRKDSGNYYDRFRNRIIFPIRDQRGRAIGLGGRVLDQDDTPKYLNSPETPIFHKGRELYGLYQARKSLKECDHLYVVEGYMDVLALAQHGIPNCVATLGTAATSEHLDRLFRSTSRIIFCFDGDTAGDKAAWRAMEVALPLLREGRQIFFMFMPEGQDPDDFVRQFGAEKFTSNDQRVALSSYLFETLREQIDLSTLEGRARFAEKAIPYISRIPAGALQALLISDLAKQCQLQEEALVSLLKETKPAPEIVRSNVRSAQTARRCTPMTPISKAIQLLLHHPQLSISDEQLTRLRNIKDPGVEFLLELLEFCRSQKQVNTARILEHWRDNRYGKRLRELATQENPLIHDDSVDDEAFKNELIDYISDIERSIHEEKRQMQRRNIKGWDDFRQLYDKSIGKPGQGTS
ncbi:MAG: DNA primase [Gammaproteobacteria bacterium]|nr:DNA primase [Gammaproteobacteria bacterium]NIO61696.1 DNA primase [Gammaproteobacteria bacterium]NIP49316.1 DNA primase [Gammaproteobacteria bacterium]NIQ10538.1 DNA primase [Gammaproteobacteria bacterium]NIQ18947.1 DNA primase [Gammaproteobacteria bacterium]